MGEDWYALLFGNHPIPMWVFDEDTLRFLAVNDAAVARYGYSRDEFLSMTIRDIRPPEDVPALMQTLHVEDSTFHESGVWRHRRKDGTVLQAEITSHTIPWEGREAQLVMAMDVTARRRLESQLRQAQKLEAVGRLASGVAHDFNNLLTVIGGFAELLLERTTKDDPSHAFAREIVLAGEKATGLTRQLLTFSRRQPLSPAVLDLNAVVGELTGLLARLVGNDVAVVPKLQPSLGAVRADPGQLGQVLLNLAANARDAMPNGGELLVETRDIELDEQYARTKQGLVPGPYVLLSVSDTGTGMDAETFSHLFEPFFTTKPPGKGTGLGLATVFGIVKQSEGEIEVYTVPGRGTTVKLYFPRVAASAEPAQGRRSSGIVPARTGDTVLLVEDDEAVRRSAATMLDAIGYTVLAPPDAPAALALAASHPAPIAALITDLVMPGMDGAELAARVTGLRPTRVLFVSGYSEEAAVRLGNLPRGSAFLQKPFTPAGLSRTLYELLTSPAPVDPR